MHLVHICKLRKTEVQSQKFNPVPDEDHTLYGEYSGVTKGMLLNTPEGVCVSLSWYEKRSEEHALPQLGIFCIVLAGIVQRGALCSVFVWTGVLLSSSLLQSKPPLCLLICQLTAPATTNKRPAVEIKSLREKNRQHLCKYKQDFSRKLLKRDDLEGRCYI